MNGVSGVNGSSGVSYTSAMTPDALMAYCASRLRGLDGEMATQFEKQQQYRNSSSAVNRLQSKLADLSNRPNGLKVGDADHNATWTEVHDLFNKAMEALPPGSQQRAQLQTTRTNWEESFFTDQNGDGEVNKEEFTNLASQMSAIAKDLGSSAELDMIQLQSLMSQRQTAIQMCTNLISSLGESAKTIAQKIGS